MILPFDFPKGFEFHHLGYATTSLEKERNLFEILGYQIEGKPFSDPRQGVSGCFLSGPGPRIEILENLPNSNTLTPWIDAKIKIYHFGYLVDRISDAIDWARSHRCKVIVPPIPASAFDEQEIGFVMYRNGMIIEFIQNADSLHYPIKSCLF